MSTIHIPFGFETDVSTDTDPENYRDIKGYQARVTLNGIVVFSRYYREKYAVSGPWMEAHPPPRDGDEEAKHQWSRDLQQATKDTAEDDKDAADLVLTAFAHRLALTLTWPDGA